MRRSPFFRVVSENLTGGGAIADSQTVDAATQVAITTRSARFPRAEFINPRSDFSDGRAPAGFGGQRIEERCRGHATNISERTRRESAGVRDGEADAFQVALARDAWNLTRVAGCGN